MSAYLQTVLHVRTPLGLSSIRWRVTNSYRSRSGVKMVTLIALDSGQTHLVKASQLEEWLKEGVLVAGRKAGSSKN